MAIIRRFGKWSCFAIAGSFLVFLAARLVGPVERLLHLTSDAARMLSFFAVVTLVLGAGLVAILGIIMGLAGLIYHLYHRQMKGILASLCGLVGNVLIITFIIVNMMHS
jgi:hypothetical protein